MPQDNTSTEDTLITDFADPNEAEGWITIDDVVMGGKSASKFAIRDSQAVFAGAVSLENNGGFASTRTLPRKLKLEGYTGFRVRVKGDGKSYRFRARADAEFDGVAFQLHFETKAGEWAVVDLPFDQFVASFRGRLLPDAGPLDPAKIQQIGFLIADKQAGRFELIIDWIKAYRQPSEP